jgi:cytochrome c5
MRIRVFCSMAFLCTALLGCGERDPQNTASPLAQPFADAKISSRGQQRWASTCAMCHVRGEGGAPKIGDTVAWSTRLAQGEAVVLDHTVNGFGNMPPLGYCMDCEREDLRAYIAFMAYGGGA